jgi:hypothetical protein
MSDRPFIENVEDFITEFINSVGGKTVVEKNGGKCDFLNADYIFEKENVIAELKCLEKDIFSDEDFERNERLMEKWFDDGTLRKVDIIPIFLNRKQIPESCLVEIDKLTRRTYQKIIHKANKQLHETKNKLGNEKTMKFLMLCNDGNYFLSHKDILSIACNLLATRKEWNIDCLIYFTVNQGSMFELRDLDRHVWVPFYGFEDEEGNTTQQFVNQLGRDFWKFMNEKFGYEISEHQEIEEFEKGMETTSKLKYIPKDIIFRKK